MSDFRTQMESRKGGVERKRFAHSLVESPDISSIQTTDGRYYVLPNDMHLPSVTTVMGHENEAFFAEWRKNKANERKLKRSLARGDALHAAIEDYIWNREVRYKNEMTKMLVQRLAPLLHNISLVRGIETPLYSHTLGLAGRADCVGVYNGKLSIIDFKGSEKIKEEKWIQGYYKQATCYSIMWQELYGEKVPQIVILMAAEDGESKAFVEKPVNFVGDVKKTLDSWKKKQEGA